MKNNSKLISKRCSTPSLPLSLATALIVASLSPLAVFAAIPPQSQGSNPLTLRTLHEDLTRLSARKGTGFSSLVSEWENKYGAQASSPLFELARNPKEKDTDRYIALMAIAKIIGPRAAPSIEPFLKDSSWMVRSGSMKALAALNQRPGSRASMTDSGKKMIPLLNDPALVVRAEATQAVAELNPPGAAEALLKAVYDGKNYRPGDYRKGKADWVPQKALAALRKLKPHGFSHRLLPLMNEAGDRKLRAHALFTIEALEGRHLKKGSPFKDRALAWNRALSGR